MKCSRGVFAIFFRSLPGKSLTPEELVAFCRERLSGYKCPRTMEILDELPKNALGKILKTELRSRFWDGRNKRVN